MTLSKMNKFLEDAGNKQTAEKIFEALSGNSYEKALLILEVVKIYLKKGSVFDSTFLNNEENIIN